MATLRAPTGEVAEVPDSLVAHYVARGAVPIGPPAPGVSRETPGPAPEDEFADVLGPAYQPAPARFPASLVPRGAQDFASGALRWLPSLYGGAGELLAAPLLLTGAPGAMADVGAGALAGVRGEAERKMLEELLGLPSRNETPNFGRAAIEGGSAIVGGKALGQLARIPPVGKAVGAVSRPLGAAARYLAHKMPFGTELMALAEAAGAGAVPEAPLPAGKVAGEIGPAGRMPPVLGESGGPAGTVGNRGRGITKETWEKQRAAREAAAGTGRVPLGAVSPPAEPAPVPKGMHRVGEHLRRNPPPRPKPEKPETRTVAGPPGTKPVEVPKPKAAKPPPGGEKLADRLAKSLARKPTLRQELRESLKVVKGKGGPAEKAAALREAKGGKGGLRVVEGPPGTKPVAAPRHEVQSFDDRIGKYVDIEGLGHADIVRRIEQLGKPGGEVGRKELAALRAELSARGPASGTRVSASRGAPIRIADMNQLHLERAIRKLMQSNPKPGTDEYREFLDMLAESKRRGAGAGIHIGQQ